MPLKLLAWKFPIVQALAPCCSAVCCTINGSVPHVLSMDYDAVIISDGSGMCDLMATLSCTFDSGDQFSQHDSAFVRLRPSSLAWHTVTRKTERLFTAVKKEEPFLFAIPLVSRLSERFPSDSCQFVLCSFTHWMAEANLASVVYVSSTSTILSGSIPLPSKLTQVPSFVLSFVWVVVVWMSTYLDEEEPEW